jgi:hypothetical protein
MIRSPLLLSSVLISFLGCWGKTAMPKNPPTAQQLLDEIAARKTQIKTISAADAKVEFWDNANGDRVKGRVSVLATREGNLRLEVNSNIGMLSALAVTGTAFQLLDVRGDHYFTGEASTCNVERVIHVRLSPHEIADALLGDAPVLLHSGAKLDWNGDDKRWVVTLDLVDGGKEKLELSEKGHNLEKAERLGPDGKRVWWLEHSDFSTVKGGAVMPERSRFQQGDKADQDVILKFKDQEVNTTPPPSSWTLEQPRGMVQEEFRCEH